MTRPLRARLLWALTKTLWATAATALILAAYTHTTPRFMG